MIPQFTTTAEQERRFVRTNDECRRYLEINDALEAAGWTKSRRRTALREARVAITGIYPIILRGELAEADRRLDVSERALAAVVATLTFETPRIEVLH